MVAPAVGPATCVACGLSTVLLALFGWLGCHPDPPQPPAALEEHYDFIVVGGGTTGCVVASRLSEVAHWKILVLEAGGEQPLWTQVPGFSGAGRESAFAWSFATQPDIFSCVGGCLWLYGKGLGGSGTIDDMQVVRGHRRDFDVWRELIGEEWSFEHMLYYFKKSENNRNEEASDWRHHGSNGPQPIDRLPLWDINTHIVKNAFVEIGFGETDLTGYQTEGVMVTQAFSYNGRRITSYDAYLLRPREERLNLRVLTRALVTKVLIDPMKKQAQGVQYIDSRGRLITAFAGLEIILSAGAINTAQILMLSGIGPGHVLGPLSIPLIEELPVGYNLHDHVGQYGLELEFPHTASLFNETEQIAHLVDYLSYQQGPLASTGPRQLAALWRSHLTPSMNSAPDVLFTLEPLPRAGSVPVYYARVRINTLLVQARSRGRITINSTDPTAPVLVRAGYLSHPEDRAVLMDAARLMAGRLAAAPSLAAAGVRLVRAPLPGCERFPWGGEEYWSCAARQHTAPGHAAAGTCRMGRADDRRAVTDPRMRVRGVSGLRVADASVLPQPIAGRLRAVCLALGERAADFVKEHHLTFGTGTCSRP